MKQANAAGELAPLPGRRAELHGDLTTHDRLNIHPSKILRGDRYQFCGQWLTVNTIVKLPDERFALYFAELVHGALERDVLPEGTMGVTVYRPKGSTVDA